MSSVLTKYDRLADQFAERSYANLAFYMHRQLEIATSWGPPVRPGDSILELGCGDGYLAQLFLQYGVRYRGVDVSPQMIAMGRRRSRDSGVLGDFMVADVGDMPLTESFDAVVSYMGTFFTYVQSPVAVLKRLRPLIHKKLLVDLNPRRDMPVERAIALLGEAGFRNVVWRPFLVPKEKRLPDWLLKTFVLCEEIPLVRSVPLRWKFSCLLMGEP
ncbi:MAG TPA: class I SAM-dependent methyltransferase [Nitrospiraceae bacterium]|nr:class I SAM-dependent methyltransferase [Nitrospiraceae bacterium]